LEGTLGLLPTRHGAITLFCPLRGPFRTNIYAMKQLGVEYLISLQQLVRTQENKRIWWCRSVYWPDKESSFHFFGERIVAHIAFADPVCNES